MDKFGMSGLQEFCEKLRKKRIHFFVDYLGAESITVFITLVGVRIEVAFFDDHLEFSVFRGSEDVFINDKALWKLIDENS